MELDEDRMEGVEAPDAGGEPGYDEEALLAALPSPVASALRDVLTLWPWLRLDPPPAPDDPSVRATERFTVWRLRGAIGALPPFCVRLQLQAYTPEEAEAAGDPRLADEYRPNLDRPVVQWSAYMSVPAPPPGMPFYGAPQEEPVGDIVICAGTNQVADIHRVLEARTRGFIIDDMEREPEDDDLPLMSRAHAAYVASRGGGYLTAVPMDPGDDGAVSSYHGGHVLVEALDSVLDMADADPGRLDLDYPRD